MEKYAAHVRPDGTEQSVKDHCENVSELACMFAQPFGLPELARMSGRMHDIGKYSARFQEHIRGLAGKVDHASAGAQEIEKIKNGGILKLMAESVVAGHHSGLLNVGSRKFALASDGTLAGRLVKKLDDYSAYRDELGAPSIKKESFNIPNYKYQRLSVSFMTRMLFSCLVDADYLDTEDFMDPGRRKTEYESIEVLNIRLNHWLDIHGWRKNTLGINGARSSILNACIDAGKWDRGLFTLTVPTGGGKTIASLAFALNHACKNNMDRVIYVIPYCSIIDQTLSVFQKILGQKNVLGHYSEAVYKDEDGNEDYGKYLATENWDSPVVVTTAVQFFESLYSCKTSRCRKLHNIANAVVIFDEAQTFPVPYIDACVAAISELVINCQSTCVLCTATQPALQDRFAEYAPSLLSKEICPDIASYSRIFRRVNYVNIGLKRDDELEALLSNEKQALCIVSTVKHAYDLYQSLKSPGIYCLTTNMLPIDRARVLCEVKDRLQKKEKCVLVATSLIEAGVDIDFPTVYRAYAGIDSMIQAGGRCNREGKRDPEKSFVYLFQEEPKYKVPETMLRPEQIARGFLDEDITSQGVEYNYLRELYQSSNCDKKGIIDLLNKDQIEFQNASENFKLIENNDWTVYIPIDDTSSDLLGKLQDHPELLTKQDYRCLGKYALHLFDTRIAGIRGEVVVLDGENKIAELIDLDLYSHDCGLAYHGESGKAFII